MLVVPQGKRAIPLAWRSSIDHPEQDPQLWRITEQLSPSGRSVWAWPDPGQIFSR